MTQRLPTWIREKKLNLASLRDIKTMLRASELHSVCESLACPNRTECFSRGTARKEDRYAGNQYGEEV